jgi:geranylgeranyl reductase family protein
MFDVAIIGGGPGGAWTAFVLARLGATVAILDGSHPREKPCGGGLTGRAVSLVSAALPAGSLPSVSIRAARFVSARHADSCEVPLAHETSEPLLVADRTTFDAHLLRAACEAGATFIPARAVEVSRSGSGFTVRSAKGLERAKLLVGADGANSLVRRSVASPFPRHQLSIATGFYAHGGTSDEIVIELLPDPPGYLWSFPRPDHLAIGICAQADAGVTATMLRERAGQWIRSHRLGATGRLTSYSWPIPSLSADALRTATLHGPDWLLVGDAAGLVDPITREGIFFAVRSGEMAAQAIAASDLGGYGARVRTEILPELERAARLKAGFFQPRFISLVLDSLRESAAIRQVMADLIAGTQPYRGLKRRLLSTLEVRLAWRLFSARMHSSRHAPALAPAAD